MHSLGTHLLFAGLLCLAPPRALGADITNVSRQTVRTHPTLPVAYYDVAELVFRQYIRQNASSDSELVFHFAYGTNNTPVPSDFLERFKGQTPIIRAGPHALVIVSNKLVLDKITRREALCLNIREIRIRGNTAEAQVISLASCTVSSTRFYLVRQSGRWRVKERETEWVGCG